MTLKTEPLPSPSDSTHMQPPWALTMFLAMTRPMPMPLWVFGTVLDEEKKVSNMPVRFFCDMPEPLSFTDKTWYFFISAHSCLTYPGAEISCIPFSRTETVTTESSFENLTEFIIRLFKTRSEERRVGKECRSRWS